MKSKYERVFKRLHYLVKSGMTITFLQASVLKRCLIKARTSFFSIMMFHVGMHQTKRHCFFSFLKLLLLFFARTLKIKLSLIVGMN